MAQADDIGNIIMLLNPYTDKPNTPNLRQSTGEIDVYIGNSARLRKSNCRWTPTYRESGSFSRANHKRSTEAVRILYRYPVLGPPAGQPPTQPVLSTSRTYLLNKSRAPARLGRVPQVREPPSAGPRTGSGRNPLPPLNTGLRWYDERDGCFRVA